MDKERIKEIIVDTAKGILALILTLLFICFVILSNIFPVVWDFFYGLAIVLGVLSITIALIYEIIKKIVQHYKHRPVNYVAEKQYRRAIKKMKKELMLKERTRFTSHV